MGARAYMSPRLLQILPEHLHFGYIGRPERAASGEGYPIAHATEQNRIVDDGARLSRAGLAVPAQAARRALSAPLTALSRPAPTGPGGRFRSRPRRRRSAARRRRPAR